MPLYQLSIDNRDGTVKQPVYVTVRRAVEEVDPEDAFAVRLEAEASKEQIEIVQAEDSSPAMRNVTARMILSFRTIGQDAFWLDTGVLNIP